MKKSLSGIGMQYGLFAGLVSVGYAIVGYIIGPEMFTNWWAGILVWIVSIVLLIMGVTTARKQFAEPDGAFPFKSAYTVFLIGGIVVSLIGAIFNIVLFNVIDPSFQEALQEEILETTVSMMERFGAPDEAIDEAIEKATEDNQFSLMNQLKGIPFTIVFYAVIGLLVAAATKRKGQVFGE